MIGLYNSLNHYLDIAACVSLVLLFGLLRKWMANIFAPGLSLIPYFPQPDHDTQEQRVQLPSLDSEVCIWPS